MENSFCAPSGSVRLRGCGWGLGARLGLAVLRGSLWARGPGRGCGWAWESARGSSPKLMRLFFAGLYVRVSDCILFL